MQNISSLALILWELLKKKGESLVSLIKFQQFFNQISVPRKKFKDLVGSFLSLIWEVLCKISAL